MTASESNATSEPAAIYDIITDEVGEFLNRQSLGYVATASVDGKPNVSPKGTVRKWDGHTLIFAILRSPDTVRNLSENPSIEINAMDPVLRKGYLFEGTASIVNDTVVLDKMLEYYKKIGIKNVIKSIVAVKVSSVTRVTSPLYDLGITEEEIKKKWIERLTT